MTSKNLRVGATAMCLDDFIPRLTYSIQHLMKVLVDSLNRSPTTLNL